MIVLSGLVLFTLGYLTSRAVSQTADSADGDTFNRALRPGIAARLMEQADACAGISPHRAQELRTAAMACLRVMGQR